VSPSARRIGIGTSGGSVSLSDLSDPVGDAEIEPDAADPHQPAGNKATARVLLVLEHLTRGSESYGVSELSRELGMTKNMVHRALATLSRNGYVVRDASGTRYRLGPGILQLGAAGLPELNLPQLCDPFMRRMRDLTGETVTLAVPFDRSAVTVGGARGRGTLARTIPTGRVLPLHVSPAGRAILSYFPDDALERYLAQPLERITERTLVDPPDVRAEVAAVRARGYATVLGDHWRGIQGAAFPVLASGDYPHGSITVGGPSERFSVEDLHAVLPALRHEMAEVNRHAGVHSSTYATVHPAGGE
jgi:DNA-binding IclR family transcriptional regulator